MNQEIKKGVHIELELKEIRKENKHSYYIVTLNGEEHSIGMFPFQLDQDPAKTLHCYVKDVIDGKPLLVQDYSYLLKELYTVGQSYTFTVRRNFTQLPEPFYEVVDEKGIPLNLRKYGTAKLSERQKIECTVTALKGSHIELELKDYIKDDYVNFLTLNDVISIIGSEDEFVTRWIEPNLLKQPWLMLAREKYEQRDPEWLFTAILALKEHLSEWVDPEKDYVERMLSAYLKLILYLLEESDIMRKMAAQERRLMRQELSQLAMDVKDYQTASAYIIGNASESFVEELFRKMNTSGYLFEPEKKLRILKCMFSISPTLLQDHIEAIFNTLNGKDRETWMKEPFRTSFIAILELYIRKNSPNADFELNTNSAAGMKLMEKLIRALAIQLLMTNNNDDIDRPLNRSMLYRYCTFFNATYQQKLLDNAFLCLSQAEQSRLEYTWADINDIRTLANKLAFSHSSETSKIHYVQYFKSSTMQLRLFNDAIQVLPASHEELAKQVLPAGLLPWHDFQVYQREALTAKINPASQDLNQYTEMWNEIERTFNSAPSAPKVVAKKVKCSPGIGDRVTIRITSQDNYEPGIFHCNIEDDTFQGQGTIKISDIVRYRPYPDITAFFDDKECTQPYLLEVKVKDINPDGSYQFEMISLMVQLNYKFYNLGDTVHCLIKDHKPNMKYYVCVDSWGFSFWVEDNGSSNLPVGSYITATVSDFHPKNGNIIATLVCQEDSDIFSETDAFIEFIHTISEGIIYKEHSKSMEDGEEEPENAEIMMDEAAVNELIVLLDYKAVQEEDQVRTYNYLAAARLLSLLLKRNGNELTKFYEERMRLLRMMQDFAVNGNVDTEALVKLSRKNEMLIKKYPILSNHMTKLDIMDCLNKPEKEPFLLQKLQETKTEGVKKLADLVLANNILLNFGMREESKAVMQKIRKLLKLKLEDMDAVSFGEEGQRKEFKTSTVYTPGNAKTPNPEEQTGNVMKVICGFLNTEGGKLYIGVNDYGIANGLDADLEYFNQNKDEFDRNIRNHIKNSMGLIANSCIHSSFLRAGKKWIYLVEVKPCKIPIMLGGKIILRQGSSDYAIENEMDRMHFEEERPAIYQKLMEAEDLEQTESPEDEMPEVTVEEIEETPQLPAPLAEPLLATDDTLITTSTIRDNAVMPYEENYGIETVAYFHFLKNNQYKLTTEGIYEDVLLSLAIHEREEDGFLIIVYQSGKVLRVAMDMLLEKQDNRQAYMRCTDEKPFFACPAAETDYLFLVMKDDRGQEQVRLDDMARIAEDKISSGGKYLNMQCAKNTGVVKCEILSAKQASKLKRFCNLRDTFFGLYIRPEEKEELKRMGVEW